MRKTTKKCHVIHDDIIILMFQHVLIFPVFSFRIHFESNCLDSFFESLVCTNVDNILHFF